MERGFGLRDTTTRRSRSTYATRSNSSSGVRPTWMAKQPTSNWISKEPSRLGSSTGRAATSRSPSASGDSPSRRWAKAQPRSVARARIKPSAVHSRCWRGSFKNHQGMVKDLLADVGRSSKPYLLYQLQRLLHSNTNNLFNQLNDANVAKMQTALACGRVAKASAEVLIGKVISHSFEKDSSYHMPIREVTSRDDVEYDTNVMLRARRTIAGHVKSGRPVLVGIAVDPA